jgi:hypothetical protein
MGRSSSATVIANTTRLELSYLIKQGFIRKDCSNQGAIEWGNGNSVYVKSYYGLDEAYIDLKYKYQDQVIEHRIKLVLVPSNLGKGDVLYFICPQTHKRCRILYLCDGTPVFKSREAYSKRIYYESQRSSYLQYHNDKYWSYKTKLETLYEKSKKSHYRGKPTRLEHRIEKLESKRIYHDSMMFSRMPASMRSLFSSL